MAYLLREGEGKGIALYTRCEDILLAKAELALLAERVKCDHRFDGKPIYGFIDVDPSYTISQFTRAYHKKPVEYRRLMELRKLITLNGWEYPEIRFDDSR